MSDYPEEFDDDEEGTEDEKLRKKESKKSYWKTEAIDEADIASRVSDKFGLCAKCGHVDYERTKYGAERAFCGYWGYPEKHPLRTSDPVVECSNFKEAGQMDLQTMWRIATFIDPKKGDGIGF